MDFDISMTHTRQFQLKALTEIPISPTLLHACQGSSASHARALHAYNYRTLEKTLTIKKTIGWSMVEHDRRGPLHGPDEIRSY